MNINVVNCTSLGESRSSIAPGGSLEHATCERATMQALRPGSGTPWLFQADSCRFPPRYRQENPSRMRYMRVHKVGG